MQVAWSSENDEFNNVKKKKITELETRFSASHKLTGVESSFCNIESCYQP